MRELGSAALSLAYVAKGVIDCYAVEDLKPWDLAAGSILVREAGGQIYNTDGSEYSVTTGKILCGSSKELCDYLIENIKEIDSMKLNVAKI